MAFTKKDYEAIADIISNYDTKCFTMMRLADYFAKNNPRFNREAFYKACGIKF